MNQPSIFDPQPANTSAGDPLETYLAKHNLTPKDLMNPNGSFTHHAIAFAFEHGGANPGADPRLFVSSLEGGLKRLALGVVDVRENPDAQEAVKAIAEAVRGYLKVYPRDSRRAVLLDLRSRQSFHRNWVIKLLREQGIEHNAAQLKVGVEVVWGEYQGGSR
jgi:hypothetical protein